MNESEIERRVRASGTGSVEIHAFGLRVWIECGESFLAHWEALEGYSPSIRLRAAAARANAKVKVNPAVQKANDVYPCHRRGKTLKRTDAAGIRCSCPGKWLKACSLHGACRIDQESQDGECCRTCEDREAVAPKLMQIGLPKPSVPLPTPPGIPAGAVIGSFGLPRLIELQIRLIRHHCGPVPILITDDCSDGYAPSPDGDSKYGQLCRLTRDYPDVRLISNPQRVGHAGGDLGKLWWGVQWAAVKGLRVAALLSQRFLIDRPNWLQDGAAELLASGLGTASQPCKEGWSRFAIRSEAMLVDVAKWDRPDVYDHLHPRVLSFLDPRKVNGVAAEIVYWDSIRHRIDPPGKMHPWSLMQHDRQKQDPGVVWHCSHGIEDYRRLATAHGLELDAGFTCAGWQSQPAYKW